MPSLDSAVTYLRSYRLGPFSAIDTIGAYLLVYALAPFLSRQVAKLGITITRLEWVALTLPIALATHTIFGVESAFTKMFFDPANYGAKILILAMVLFGLKSAVRIYP
ncbi:MAG: hypothetical protein V4674_00570 [Patescibacteria group bacterium]